MKINRAMELQNVVSAANAQALISLAHNIFAAHSSQEARRALVRARIMRVKQNQFAGTSGAGASGAASCGKVGGAAGTSVTGAAGVADGKVGGPAGRDGGAPGAPGWPTSNNEVG